MKLITTLALMSLSTTVFAGEQVCMKQLDLTLTHDTFTQQLPSLKVRCGGDAMISAEGVTVSWKQTQDLIVSQVEAGKPAEISSQDGTHRKAIEQVQRQITLPGPLADSFTVPFGDKLLKVKTTWMTVADNSKTYAAKP